MAIQTRGGNEVDFQPNKMLPREMAGVLDSKKVFYTFAPGDCRRLATHEEMTEMIDESVEGIKQGFTADLTQAITDSETATATANASAQNAEDKSLLADEAKDRANQAAADAESIVLEKIATDTTVGVVKSGGDVTVEVDGTMSVSEAGNASVTIVEALEDGEITTGLLGAILGLVKKKFSIMLNDLAGKIDKTSIAQSAEISDATKVPSTVVTGWLASQISSLVTSITGINNNLATFFGAISFVSGYVTEAAGCNNTVYKVGKMITINACFDTVQAIPAAQAFATLGTIAAPDGTLYAYTIVPMIALVSGAMYYVVISSVASSIYCDVALPANTRFAFSCTYKTI